MGLFTNYVILFWETTPHPPPPNSHNVIIWLNYTELLSWWTSQKTNFGKIDDMNFFLGMIKGKQYIKSVTNSYIQPLKICFQNCYVYNVFFIYIFSHCEEWQCILSYWTQWYDHLDTLNNIIGAVFQIL